MDEQRKRQTDRRHAATDGKALEFDGGQEKVNNKNFKDFKRGQRMTDGYSWQRFPSTREWAL